MLRSRISRYMPSSLFTQGLQAEVGEGQNRLFEHLVSEVHAVGVDIAVATTAVNALNDWRTPIDPVDVARFAPHSSMLRALLPVLESNHALDGQTTVELHSFMAEVDAARAILDNFLDDCDAISASRASLVHARLLRTQWKVTSLRAKQFILELERGGAELPELYQQNTRILSALLTGAGNGLKPCLDENGRLYVPPLPQRRRAPRRSVLQNCIVHGPASSQTGFIRDASAGGLGLGRIAGLKRGDQVRIELASGRQLHGTVAWITGSSAGVSFDVSLAPSDSLIAL